MNASEVATRLLEETLTRLFERHCDAAARQAAEAEGWAAACWGALAEVGLPFVGVPQVAGGSGGDLGDACALVRLAGRHAVPLPLAECALLGGWLVASAGLVLPPGPVTVAPSRSTSDVLAVDGTKVSGRLAWVPWGGRAATVVALATSREHDQVVVLVDPTEAAVVSGHNVAGEPRDTLILDRVALSPDRIATAPADLVPELALRGALSRALLMAGAMEAVAILTLAYAGERRQFGRPIASFQAVAQRLVRLASETEAAALAAQAAARCFADVGTGAAFEVAAAKASTARAASEVAAHAHQVHGAIGMTREYPLHHFTRRLWAWRQEWGSEQYWVRVLGHQVIAGGAEELWPRLTGWWCRPEVGSL